MNMFIKELSSGLKWVLPLLGILTTIIALWIGCAWAIGWAINHFFNFKSSGIYDFLILGSYALVFTFIIQFIVIVVISWVLISYSRSRNIKKS